MSSLKSSVILVALSLLPGAIASYTTLGLAVAAAVIYLGYRQLPSERLGRLASIIEATETQLKNAKSICARAMASLTEVEERLLHAKSTASETKVRLLKLDETESWMDYLRTIRGIIQSIADCGLDVKDIQTDILKIVMEEETQRKISEGIGEARSVLATIHSALRETISPLFKVIQLHYCQLTHPARFAVVAVPSLQTSSLSKSFLGSTCILANPV
ncbi:hypothetical protein FB45DRAFT_1040211 [Roridomyces roridus]|uniref:Fungal N-terminal domain-containing protein n=1 Tax=Roridomyces roridus TaxID=1738132 RepID=A0AAD7B177_9AGAR|nr:hypothetical protein FB45DRAFT_1040211 [Roridomyces roridus]